MVVWEEKYFGKSTKRNISENVGREILKQKKTSAASWQQSDAGFCFYG